MSNPHSLFATPIVITANSCPEEIAYQAELMLIRSQATDLFLEGRISQNDYEEIISECGVDPNKLNAAIELKLG
jgi:hypothetical protein